MLHTTHFSSADELTRETSGRQSVSVWISSAISEQQVHRVKQLLYIHALCVLEFNPSVALV